MDEHLEKFLETSRLEGELEFSGGFTLNLERARANFARYGHSSPELATLALIQALVALGCQSVNVMVDPGGWTHKSFTRAPVENVCGGGYRSGTVCANPTSWAG